MLDISLFSYWRRLREAVRTSQVSSPSLWGDSRVTSHARDNEGMLTTGQAGNYPFTSAAKGGVRNDASAPGDAHVRRVGSAHKVITTLSKAHLSGGRPAMQ
eukprot:TRINITY_DN3739_c0_g1_i2.p2 TRINITY_DN3739_c0_g1~~TRINITY_DN3739_c0_g1_i2.p2  ORF type:complete len:101 (-),score=7.83 TRINITY_DN3739_c0_g1_i2:87-389(-)